MTVQDINYTWYCTTKSTPFLCKFTVLYQHITSLYLHMTLLDSTNTLLYTSLRCVNMPILYQTGQHRTSTGRHRQNYTVTPKSYKVSYHYDTLLNFAAPYLYSMIWYITITDIMLSWWRIKLTSPNPTLPCQYNTWHYRTKLYHYCTWQYSAKHILYNTKQCLTLLYPHRTSPHATHTIQDKASLYPTFTTLTVLN